MQSLAIKRVKLCNKLADKWVDRWANQSNNWSSQLTQAQRKKKTYIFAPKRDLYFLNEFTNFYLNRRVGRNLQSAGVPNKAKQSKTDCKQIQSAKMTTATMTTGAAVDCQVLAALLTFNSRRLLWWPRGNERGVAAAEEATTLTWTCGRQDCVGKTVKESETKVDYCELVVASFHFSSIHLSTFTFSFVHS